MTKARRLLTLTGALLLFACAGGVSAQMPGSTPAPTPENPAMAGQRFDRDKETLYAIFSENKRGLSPDQQKRAYGAAKEYVRRYGGDGDTYVREARNFLKEFEKGSSQFELFTAYSEKNYVKAFELGRPALKDQPENFFVLGVLSEAGYENALAGNASLNDETVDYLRRAIKLLDTGKLSKADPFKSTDIARGFLNLALGWFLKDKAPVEAASAFRKSVSSEGPYQKNPLTYYRLGLAILKGEFAQISAEYNEKFGTKEASPEQQAMLQRVSHAGDLAVDAYARSYALSDPKQSALNPDQPQLTPEFRDKLLGQLTALYKSLHNNSDAGLTELISAVLSKPLP
jgi:hypothetical protein